MLLFKQGTEFRDTQGVPADLKQRLLSAQKTSGGRGLQSVQMFLSG